MPTTTTATAPTHPVDGKENDEDLFVDLDRFVVEFAPSSSGFHHCQDSGGGGDVVGDVDDEGAAVFVRRYTQDERKAKIAKYLEKRKRRVWRTKIEYDVRKDFANSRLRVRGRFVRKEDEQLLKEIMSMV